MISNATASINVLPFVNDQIMVYFTVIDTDNSLNQGTINSLSIMYGNVNLTQPNLLQPLDNKPIAILVTATYDSAQYIDILYIKAVYKPLVGNNFARLAQKIPKGIFTDINVNTIIGNDIQARAQMIDDYSKQYLEVAAQVYSTQYSPQLEFEYNDTVGILSNSVFPNQLFLSFARLGSVRLINYDLELFISQYIYYRLGPPVAGNGYAVYVNDNIQNPTPYWNLGVIGFTQLDATPPQTILAPSSFNDVIKNLDWTIFNASNFTPEFQQEIANLIVRISRADVGNPVTFNNDIDPTVDNFTLVGPTYPFDPRLLYGRCLEFIGSGAYPLNILGYEAPDV